MEHLKNKIDLEREISTEELEFYYFFEHDFNNDSRLDGLEILAAIKHSELGHEMETITANLTGHALKEAHSNELRDYTGSWKQQGFFFKQQTDSSFFLDVLDLIDDILKEDDKNNDGYISYIEYVFARRRENEEVKREYNKEKGTR